MMFNSKKKNLYQIFFIAFRSSHVSIFSRSFLIPFRFFCRLRFNWFLTILNCSYKVIVGFFLPSEFYTKRMKCFRYGSSHISAQHYWNQKLWRKKNKKKFELQIKPTNLPFETVSVYCDLLVVEFLQPLRKYANTKGKKVN